MQQQQTTLSLWCERLIEAGWLLALTLIPVFFNLLSARHFEPDKATTLRALVLVMATLFVIHMLERIAHSSSSGTLPTGEETTTTNPLKAAWEYLSSVPLAIPVLFYAIVFIIATITSVVPGISMWGSYQRLQGTYTNLSYIGLFLMIIATVRRREQLERIITVTLLAAAAVSLYGVIQHFQQDPLPWKGDVTERVASTMGNAIFVAAYLIMVIPLAFYRVMSRVHAAITERSAAPGSVRSSGADIGWALAYVLLVWSTMALIIAAITFGAAVQSADFRYWWVFPGSVAIATAFWVLPTLRIDTDERRVPLWPGVVLLLHVLLWGMGFATAGDQLQVIQGRTTVGMQWWSWLLIATGAALLFYVLALTLPRRSGAASPLTRWLSVGGAGTITLLLLVAIVFSQSRGPQLGLAAGLFTFFFLVLWQAMRRAKALERTGTARWMGAALIAWGIMTLAAIGFLLAFNLSDAPFFNKLRNQPYIGRFGSMLETEYGTGRVRFLIWNGDQYAGGARELITHDPVRTAIGWGPESMFVAFNPFYPPALAEVESRGASPDRSHQAFLDEMVTKGFLGLISYFFLIISFFALAWRLMRQSYEWRWQLLFVATISIVVSHLVEGLTGIPIVSTLMMLWVAMAITVSGGMLAGHYTLGVPRTAGTAPDPATTAEAATPEHGGEAQPAAPTTSKKKHKQQGQAAHGTTKQSAAPGSTGRSTTSSARSGAARVATRSSTRSTRSSNPAAMVLYAVLLVLALGSTWQLNLRTIYADMLFHMGENYSAQRNARLNEHVIALNYFLRTVRNNRTEDFYYLNLGRSLMQIADIQRQTTDVPIGTPPEESETSPLQRAEQVDQMVDELLRLPDLQAVATFVQNKTPMELMAYAEAVLERAHELNPLNKDHYANLGRLNNFWYNWTGDIRHLQDSANWYNEANETAPQDVVLLNESAQVNLTLGNLMRQSGNDEDAQAYYDHAEYLLERAQTFDANYPQYLMPLAELRKIQGDKEAAAELYARQVEVEPMALDTSLNNILAWLRDEPELLAMLRDTYMEQAEIAETASTSKNPDIVEKYENVEPAHLYSIAGLISVQASDQEIAAQAYERAVALAPENVNHRLNYTILLSDTHNYDEALAHAQKGLSLAQAQEDTQQEAAQFAQLVAIFQDRAAGGE